MSYERQAEIESLYSKQNIKEWILEEISSEVDTDTMWWKARDLIERHLAKSPEFFMSKRMRYTIVKRHLASDIATHMFEAVLSVTNKSIPVVAIATQIGLNYHDDQLNALKTGSELLGVCEALGLYTVKAGHQSIDGINTPSMLYPQYSLNDDTLSKIHTAMYLPPMVTSPLPWTDNTDGGTLLHQSSCILGGGNAHNDKQSLDVLNILQDIPWKFTSMLNEAEPSAKPKKLSESESEYRRRVDQHIARSEHSKYVYDLIKDEEKFYFVWKFDKRGRMYSQGYDINLQGSEYKKACIEFANEEIVTGV